jgi:hypothetical protein
MRVLVLTLAFLAFPALAIAQQAPLEAGDMAAPHVEMQQTTPASPAVADVPGTQNSETQPAAVEASAATPDAPAAQAGDPTTARWWWLVGAIVVAGILIVALT